MSAPSWIRDIEQASRGLPVLLAEGPDDVPLLEHFTSQYIPGWDLRLYIAAAGAKQRVIQGVTVHRPDWIGVIDWDEWSLADVQNAIAGSPRLRALPRFCIESYFCHPQELWQALTPGQRARVGDDPRALAVPILERLPDWVAHGAMWRILRRLYHATRLPQALEREPITDEAEIRRILTDWHANLAPEPVLARYRQELAQAQQLLPDEQLTRYVHGKRFYEAVVVQVLDRLFAGQGAPDWLARFRDAPIRPPADLCASLDWVFALP